MTALRQIGITPLATPDRLRRHCLDNTGTVTVAEDHVVGPHRV